MALLNWWRTCSNGSNASAAQEGYITKALYIATFMKVYRGMSSVFVVEEARPSATKQSNK